MQSSVEVKALELPRNLARINRDMLVKLFPWKLFAVLLLVGFGTVSTSTLILYNHKDHH